MMRLTCSWIMATVSLFLWTQLHAAPPEELLFGGDYEVQSIVDLNYCEQNKENDDNKADAYKHKLDLFIPKGKKDFPVLMFIHGGAWMSGDRKLYGLDQLSAIPKNSAPCPHSRCCTSIRMDAYKYWDLRRASGSNLCHGPIGRRSFSGAFGNE